MEVEEVLYTRSFTAFEPVQSEHIVQYSITRDAKEDKNAQSAAYGVRIASLTQEGKKAETCRGVCCTMDQAKRLLRFLWENSVEPGAVNGVLQDIHQMIAFTQKKMEMSGEHE